MVDESFSLPLLLEETPGISSGEAYRLREVFAMSRREEQFVRALLLKKRNLWIYRCHQQRYCGDFVVIDMSDPNPGNRSVYLIELKARAPLKIGSGGLQVRNADKAMEVLRGLGRIDRNVRAAILTGDKDAVLSRLGVEWV